MVSSFLVSYLINARKRERERERERVQGNQL